MSADDRLRLLVDSQSEYAMFVLEPDGRIATWNPAAGRIKGYTADEIVGRHFSVFYTDDAKERRHPEHELEVATETGRYEEEGWRVRKDGSRFWASVLITALHDGDGTLVGFGKVTRDLTARRLAEEQLRASARDLSDANAELEQVRLLVESVRDYAIFVLDPGGHVRTWNSGARHIKGYDRDEIVGRHFEAFYTDEDKARKHPAHELEVAAREGRFEEEGWRVRKDGSRFWANVVITALRDASGTLVGFAKVTRDLTERRAADERLRESATELARANAELEQFAAAAAHDLLSPLHTIAGFAELVEQRYGDRLDDKGRGFLTEITDGAGRMRRLIDGLLRYARSTQIELRLGPVDLAQTVDTVVRNLGGAIADASATVTYDPQSLPCVRGDGDVLVSVVQNLVANALKFSGEHAPRVEIASARDGDAWRITVADNGIGIAPEDQERIFAMFGRAHVSADRSGIGLGLAQTERLVARLGGQVGVESRPGAGSRFWFTLPAVDSEARFGRPPEGAAARDG